jgi:DNA polymerase III delta prime subunit
MLNNEKQWLFLKKSAQLGKLSHAYLFSGRSGLVKEETAREFAKVLNCQNQDFKAKPCGQCPSCTEFAKGLHPDFLWLEPEKEAEESQINLVRNLTGWLSLRPGLGGYKVAAINRLENFSFAAQSSLLKTLEEPAGQTVLIIISDYPDLLLPTIISRSQEIKFPPQPIKQSEDDFIKTAQVPLAAYFRRLKEVSENEEEAFKFLENLMAFSREEFLIKVGAKTKKGQSQISLVRLKNFLFAAEKTNYLLRRTNVNTRLALENLILNLF